MAASTAASIPDIISDFFNQIFAGIENYINNLHTTFTSVSAKRWIRMLVIVGGYILIRPLIDALFRKMYDRTQRKEKEKEQAQADSFAAAGKKAKISPNSLRGPGKVLGEVETDDEEEESKKQEGGETGKATGVSDWGKSARKRQKKYLKGLEREAEKRADDLEDEQILELLDWSESEDEKKK